MNNVKKNKKIKILYYFKKLTDQEIFWILHLIILLLLYFIIFFYITDSYKLYQLIQNDMLIFLLNIMFFLFYIFLINYIKIITSKLIKREYIKQNKSIGYLKYIPEDCFDNINSYIERNKKDLELQYEEELLKKQLSNF